VQEASSGGTNDFVAMEFIPLQGTNDVVAMEFIPLQGTNDVVAMEFIPLQYEKTIFITKNLFRCNERYCSNGILNKFTNKTLNDYEKQVRRNRAGRITPERKGDFQEDLDVTTHSI
jgi:hypothetical protein